MMVVSVLTFSAQQDQRLPTDSAQHLCPLSQLPKQHVATMTYRYNR